MAEEIQWARIRTVIEAALSRPPAERSSYVAQACGTDVALRGQVELMLSSVDESILEEDDETQALDMKPIAATPDPLIGKTLAHYEITDKIGQGGMGEVYRAWDTKLGRDVAIKVLPAEFAEDPRRLERFEREARLLASVNHPNIATIHDVDESRGVRYLVLEMVEGEDLERRIARAPIPFDEARAIFTQIADALEAAHEKGIIHRDLKPANVKVTPRGRVKVLDFGLAKILGPMPSGPSLTKSQKSSPGETRAGVIVGTVAYMSPEQARGKLLDKRTDIWSFGCTLYESLTGTSPFRGQTVFETIAAIIERDADLRKLPPAVPGPTRRLLARCLEKDPARRIGEMHEVRTALAPPASRNPRTLLTVAALSVAALVGALGVWWATADRSGGAGGAAPDPTPTVAVTAFTNLSGQHELDWLEEGLASLVRDRLVESRHVAVVSKPRWDAIARSLGDNEDINQLAASSGIGYVVSGEILSAPDGLVWTARVAAAGDGVDLVARRIEGLTEESLLESTDRVALLTKQALKIPHTENVEVFAADFAAEHPGAYEAYLSGLQYFIDFDYGGAEHSFRAALDLEPGYQVARYRLAHVLWLNGRTDEARLLIGQIPDDAPLTQRERLYIDGARALFDRDWLAAKQRYLELLEEYPYELEAREFLAEVYDAEYDDERALEQLRILAEQEPENPATWVNLGETCLRAGLLEDAATALDRYVALSPQDPFGFTVLGDLHRVRGEFGQAAEQFRHALILSPGFPRATLGLALVQALDGNEARAEQLWQALVDDEDEQPGYRIDAAFELNSLLRAEGRFEESLVPLARLEPLIADEGFREAMALALRGLGWLELDRPDEARAWIDVAVERSPSVPTRYLFARGRLQLERGDLDGLHATVREIREHALPPDDPDRTEEKAASYLEAMALLAEGDVSGAIRLSRQAVELDGYSYALYELGLAAALHSADRHEEAAQRAAAAATTRDPLDPRLDLELGRVRALLIEARIRAEMGQPDKAHRLARAFLDRWADAPRDHPDVVLARRLAGPG